MLLVHPDPLGWTATLEHDLALSRDALQTAFFAPHWPDIIRGRAGLRDRLAPVLARIAPHLTAEILIRYWFQHDAHVDEVLLSDLQRLRSGGLPVHLATVQEHDRAAYLWEELGWRHRFDGLHYAAELGCAKPEPGFYAAIEARLAMPPERLFLIDDRQDNIAAAQARGWGGALWTGAERVAALLPLRR